MSIAEQIMLGSQQQSKNWAVLSDNLGQLGQQVGQFLATKEYQNQARSAIPAMQQTYRSAFDKIEQGNLSEGYSQLMDAQIEYGSSTNPIIQNMNKQMSALSKQYADDYINTERLRVTEAMYGQRYGGEARVAPDVNQTLASLNNPNASMETQGVAYDQGAPVGDQRLYNQAVTAGSAGQPFPFATARKVSPTLQQAQGIPAMGDQPIEGELPQPDFNTPPVEVQPLAKGPVQPQSAQGKQVDEFTPPKNILEKSTKLTDKFNNLDSVERATVMDNQSILFPDQKKATDFVNQPSKDKSFFPVNQVTTIGVPGVVAVEMPKEFEKWINAGANVNKDGEISYSLKPEAQNNTEAQMAVKWLEKWQEASSSVSADPKLRDLIAGAGGDILKVNLTQEERSPTKEEIIGGTLNKVKENLASVQGADGGNIRLTDDQYRNMFVLRNQTSAAQMNKARFIRVDQPTKKPEESKAVQQPTSQKRQVEVFTDAKGRYYLNKQGQKVYK